MPDNLDQFSDELKEVKRSADDASQSVQELIQAISQLIKETATGGRPTAGRVEEIAQKLISGEDVATRASLGQRGVRLSGTREFGRRLYEIINEAVAKGIDVNLEQVRTQIESLVRARGFSIETPTVATGTGTGPGEAGTVRGGSPHSAEEVLRLLGQGGAEQKTNEKLERLKEQLAAIDKLFSGDLAQRITDIYNGLGRDADKIKVEPVRNLDNALEKFSVTLKDGTQSVIPKFDLYMNELGQVFDEAEVKSQAITTIGDRLLQLKKLVGESATAKIEQLIGQQPGEVTGVKVSPRTPFLDPETNQRFERFNTTLQQGKQDIASYTIILDSLGNAFEKVEKQVQDATENVQKFDSQSLQAKFGEQRARIAEEYAQRTAGFGIENLQKVKTQEPTGITFFKYAQQTDEGFTRELEFGLDRFGGVVTTTNKRLLGFFEAIKKNTVEVIRWSVGVGLVYSSFYRLQELVQVAIDNEAKLADITIALGDAHRDLNSIFDDAAQVANLTGESINGVLEAYTLAYRAVGGVRNEFQRTAVANKVLTDATILNKLSSLDAASAMDVLTASMRQFQDPNENAADALQRGTEFLDRWIQVTRVANVDVATLATAFSVTAESARNSGLSIEELNAVIASLSEKIGGLGGEETGNVIRALIGGIYQDQAAVALNQYGIAVEDTSGKMRNFLDISRDIYDLYKQGVLQTDQLNELALTLGGGVRRGQQYAAFLTDLDRIQEIVVAQTESQGAAQEALAIKTQTLQTGIQRLGNSMQQLAQTLGTDGGVLDATSLLLNTLTSLIGVVDNLSSALGSLTVPAALLSILGIYQTLGGVPARSRVGFAQEQFGASVFNLLARGTPSRERTLFAAGAGRFAQQNALGIGLGALPALADLGEGEGPEDLVEAGAHIGGAIVGTLIAGGNPIGGVIGSAIAGFLADSFFDYESDFRNFFSDVFPTTTEEGPTEVSDAEKARQEATRSVFRSAGFGSEYLGKLGAQILAGGINAYQSFRNQENQINLTPEQIALTRANAEAISQLADAINQSPRDLEASQTSLYGLQENIDKAFSDIISDIQGERRGTLQGQVLEREISPKQYQESITATGGLASALTRTYAALNVNAKEALQVTDDNIEKFRELAFIITEGSNEDREAIASLVTEITTLSHGLDEIKGLDPSTTFEFGDDVLNSAEATEILNQRIEDLGFLLGQVAEQIETARLSRINLPSFVGLEDTTEQDLGKILQRARELNQEDFSYFIQQGIFTQEDANAMVENADPIFIYLGELLGRRLAEGITDSKYITQAQKELEALGKIAGRDTGYQFLSDVTQQQFQAILPQYDALRQSIQAAGGTTTETPLVTFFQDSNSPIYMQKDWKLVQYLLQKILDEEKKQVQGIYNLPTDASFFVPFQGYELGVGGGGTEFPTPGNLSVAGGTTTSDVIPTTEIQRFKDSLLDVNRTIQDTVKSNITRPTELRDVRRGNTRPYGTEEEEPPSLLSRIPGGNVWEQVIRGLENFRTEYGSSIKEDIRGFSDDILNAIGSITGLQLGDTGAVSEGGASGLSQLLADFGEFLRSLQGGTGAGAGVLTGSLDTSGAGTLNYLKRSEPIEKIPETRLSLDITSNVQLIVDGRVLANIVKAYLYEDLVRFEGTAGAEATRTVVI